MSKDFTSLTTAECKIAAEACLKNASSKYKEAKILSASESYGGAIHSLTICIEETLKALVLAMDSNGFKLRKVKGIKSFFINHNLKYVLGLALTSINVFAQDLSELLVANGKIPGRIVRLNKIFKTRPQFFNKVLINILLKIENEIEWFAKLDSKRQMSNYVDYKDELSTPEQITEQEYLKFKDKMDLVQDMARFAILATDFSADKVNEEQKQLNSIKKDKRLYDSLAKFIKIANNRDKKHFDLFKQEIFELVNEISAKA